MTYTYVIMELSRAAFQEIKAKMIAADYRHAFQKSDGRVVIDMHGIAVTEKEPE